MDGQFQNVGLTLKQRKWVKEYLATGNAAEAARLAGYCCKNEANYRYIGYQNYTKLHIFDMMEELGLSDVNLIKLLAQGLLRPVKRILKRIIFVQSNGGQIKQFEYQEVPDYSIRHKYLVTSL